MHYDLLARYLSDEIQSHPHARSLELWQATVVAYVMVGKE